RMIFERDWDGLAGTLLLIPVVNLLAFMNHDRELPDGRDLNRMFPGSPTGSSANRVAYLIYTHVVSQSDFGIDLHTAGRGRTNYPHVRGDLSDPKVRRMAKAFGADIVLDGISIPNSLRGTATTNGIPVITFEAGEPLKFQRECIEYALWGLRNVLIEQGMLPGLQCVWREPLVFKRTKWVRAERGGIVDLIARPGQCVREGQILATIHTPFGREVAHAIAPFDALVIGQTTIPTLHPGDPLYHLGRLDDRVAELVASPLPLIV
ncbi:MAG: succinylglutamate desuccinylase/aspartoacylase family protein, partial [bacterium]